MTADQALRAYYARKARGSTARAASITVGRGWRWAEKCGACGGTTHSPKLIGKPRAGLTEHDYIERCDRCGTVWEHEAVEELRPTRPRAPQTLRSGVIASRGSTGARGSSSAGEQHLNAVADLERAIFRTPPHWSNTAWRFHLQLFHEHVLNGATYQTLSEVHEGELASTGRKPTWQAVRRMMRDVRQAIEARL